MVIGITLGVAVVVAVDLANASASRAFDLSTQAVAGKATHQVTGGPQGLDQADYVRLKRAGLAIPLAPVISEYVWSAQLGNRPLQLLGVDPFAEAPFRDYLRGDQGGFSGAVPGGGASAEALAVFMTQPGAILISEELAEQYSLGPCPTVPVEQRPPSCRISLEVAGQTQEAFIAGLLQPPDELNRRALEGLLLTDISTAQELTGRLGRLDRIDLILPGAQEDQAALQGQIGGIISSGAVLQAVEARQGSVLEMTAAFRVNLTALSLLALVVGMFLIYNTITFSVVQRRPLFGTLRCLGVTQREIFGLVLSEALLVGTLGASLGVVLGVVMGQGAVRLVTQTINDLFFVVTVRGVQVPWASLVKGSLLGIGATLLTAAPPAWEAASVPPRAALSRSGLESKARRAVGLAAGLGLGMVLLGILLLVLPGRSLVVSFGGTFAVIVGFAMFVPAATGVLMRAAIPALGRAWGTLGRMAPRNVANSLSRTAIAIMALMVAVSVTIGVSLMVSSFRSTVVAWLDETLQGDVYISAPSPTATTPTATLSPEAVQAVREWPGAEQVYVLRAVEVDAPSGKVSVAATDNHRLGLERAFLALDVPEEQVWEQMQGGAVIVSEPLANRLGLPRHGGAVTLYTTGGARQFPVAGIYYDYASTRGTVLMALPVYQQAWQDQAITAMALRLAPGADVDQAVSELQMRLSPLQRLLVRANQALRQEVLVVFDRTFAITGALQLLATLVAFIGVLSALLSLELERQRELGILRSIGMTVRQLWASILLETGLMGAVAGLFAMPIGYLLALILVFIINRRSFGWTLQMEVDWLPFAEALLVSLAAAMLAGLYPALRMGKMITSEALRSE